MDGAVDSGEEVGDGDAVVGGQPVDIGQGLRGGTGLLAADLGLAQPDPVGEVGLALAGQAHQV
ncbi:hypothetical protein PZB75_30285 [Streptomyces sp. AM 4-1-1]|uniref:hypothetical protein n=1 Tax=unclassified Streptomyces TaxID=2593676 RepID=UPI0023B9B131|nr:hypothetical protein [Streptomyces sp. AM 4-1-1]WEH37274.1 hypothetical protein PZB75_30285 [Streptomyces sp. AM 4-1-1]